MCKILCKTACALVISMCCAAPGHAHAQDGTAELVLLRQELTHILTSEVQRIELPSDVPLTLLGCASSEAFRRDLLEPMLPPGSERAPGR